MSWEGKIVAARLAGNVDVIGQSVLAVLSKCDPDLGPAVNAAQQHEIVPPSEAESVDHDLIDFSVSEVVADVAVFAFETAAAIETTASSLPSSESM